jgi:phospholipase C
MWQRLEQREIRRRLRVVPLQPGDRPDPSRPAGTDTLPEIKHIVVLMMENHSFDNYLGTMTGRREGLPLDDQGWPAAENLNKDGKPVRSYRFGSTHQVDGTPCQSWNATHMQWNGGGMDGFVTATQEVDPDADASVAMGYWTEEDLPFYHGLAKTFPLANRWFSSCLGPTFPNRRFLIAGTANGLIDDLPLHLLDYPAAGTIFDTLSQYGISWTNYHPTSGDDHLSRARRFASYRRRALRRRSRSWMSRHFKMVTDMQKDIVFTADLYPMGIARHMLHVRGMDAFCEDAANGTLPAFSIVDPSFEEYSEENPQDIRKGESFAADVINRVLHGKGWPNTLLIWTYDEHGGYYDHVPPPAAVPPDDVDGRSMTRRGPVVRLTHRLLFPQNAKSAENDVGPMHYDQYGVRVPAVIVSPYARPDCVLSDVFDHTSVLKLVEEKWNLPALTKRDAAALSPVGALDFSAPPAFLTPPSLPEPGLKWGSW